MHKKGKFVVFEGIDGSGKTTQFLRLQKRFEEKGIRCSAFDFPRYHDSSFGALIGRMLSGEFGTIDKLNPYLAALPYMIDQAHAAEQIKEDLAQGFFVLSNRYFTSNFGHQAGKFHGRARKEFCDWLIKAGYKEMGIVKEDVVLFFDTPPKTTKELLTFRKGEKDESEKDRIHQTRSYEAFLEALITFNHWIRVECVRGGEVLSQEEIHQSVCTILGI